MMFVMGFICGATFVVLAFALCKRWTIDDVSRKPFCDMNEP